MSLNIRPLAPELAEMAVKELNEVPLRIADDIKALKDWIAKQPHLRARTDDQFLLSFLRGSKHSLERAKEKLDLFYSVRTSLAGVFTDEDPTSARTLELIRMGTMLPLPNTATPDSPRIVLIRFAADPSSYSLTEIIRVQFFINSILIKEDDNMIVAGQVGLGDFKGASMGHFAQFSPSLMKKSAILTQDANTIRMKGFNYIHVPSFFESFFLDLLQFKFFIPLQMYVHPDNESLFKEIPQKLLPVEYGGENGTIDDLIKYWENKIVENRDYLIEESKYGTDESKRATPLKQHDALFGAEGSFRKLDLD